METIVKEDGTRIEIPDAVIAASSNRDLVADYVEADDEGRAEILALAIDAVTPKEEEKAEETITVAGGSDE